MAVYEITYDINAYARFRIAAHTEEEAEDIAEALISSEFAKTIIREAASGLSDTPWIEVGYCEEVDSTQGPTVTTARIGELIGADTLSEIVESHWYEWGDED